uniref:Caprin family member 2 n=1 Tax=Amphilophus citrinellus TaxID=61819 RepID=A0A3Q0RDW1_AMPCI
MQKPEPLNMVQLSPSPTLDLTPPPEHATEGEGKQEDSVTGSSLKMGSPGGLNTLQFGIEVSTSYHGYETYIEDGLICLKHKVRNLEKKKLKLQGYKKRLRQGEVLNKDQMAAVEKYAEVLHNLEFARELHKTLDGLTQNLLKAQKKVMKKEQMAKVEAERRRLATVLQVHHLLASLQEEHVRRDLLAGCNQAPCVPAQQLHSLTQLTTLFGVKRDNRLSLKEQMEQAALAYLDLLEGKEKPVAGSSFKLLKEELTKLLNCKYFSCLPPSLTKTPASHSSKLTIPTLPLTIMLLSIKNLAHSRTVFILKLETPVRQSQLCVADMENEQEPPDCWDMEFPDGSSSPQTAALKPWRGAATLIPKVIPKKAKQEPNSKLVVDMDIPVEDFISATTLPKDPILRKQHLEDLMTNINGSFSFMQDSLLDGESLSTNEQINKIFVTKNGNHFNDDLLSHIQSTPLQTRLLERRASQTNGNQNQETCDLELSSKDLPHVRSEIFPSPPLYRRESTVSNSLEENSLTDSGKQSPCNGVASCTSTPAQGQTFSTPPTRRSLTSAQFQNIQSVNSGAFSEPRYTTASTQTPPEFAPSEEEPQPGIQLCGVSRPSQSYYTRGSVRGMARGGKALTQTFRSSGWQRVIYSVNCFFNSTAAWSDSSQVSSPDREGAFTIVDSGHGDSLSVSTVEVPVTPHGHQHTTLLPMQLYPLSQPLRVAFTASRTANFAPGNLDQPIVFDQLHSNLGEMYDTHIGRFTCPVNGTYVFIFHILKLAINVPLYINLMRNEDVMVSAYANDGAPDHETASNHAILPLFQGDQVWLRLHRGAIYGSTWKYSTFSGFLLYQD